MLPHDLGAAAAEADSAHLDASLQRAWGLVFKRVRARGVTDRHDAEDLTQEVFLRVLARIGESDPGGPIVRAYLVRAAEHLVTDRQRRMAHREALLRAPGSPLSAGREPEQSAEERALGAFDEAAALAALARLPALHRQVLRLRIFEELSAEATGEIVGRSAAAVRQIQHRAVLRLRQQLEPGQ